MFHGVGLSLVFSNWSDIIKRFECLFLFYFRDEICKDKKVCCDESRFNSLICPNKGLMWRQSSRHEPMREPQRQRKKQTEGFSRKWSKVTVDKSHTFQKENLPSLSAVTSHHRHPTTDRNTKQKRRLLSQAVFQVYFYPKPQSGKTCLCLRW